MSDASTHLADRPRLNAALKQRLIGWGIGALCAAPAVWLIQQLLNNQLGANPVEALVRQSGVLALRLLLVSLLVTPAAKLLRQPGLIRHRRTIGLWAFAMVCMHLSSYLFIDKELDGSEILKDIIKRPYITIGMAAFLALVPLAITSLDAIRRKIGPRRWRRLHQAIYLIVPMGVLHYYLLVKADHRPPLIYGAIAALLLAWRAYGFIQTLRRRIATTA
ncbi:MAG: protein-methionine-sulfoxide reductase heme-binding subunit MsrQ [Caulobacterales bacterium]